MRLLNVQTGQLEEFFHLRDPPPYAILSHTWDRTEVTLQDIKNGTAQSHPGYNKINYTCLQAAKDGYQYVWIDSCCIDKSSSAELSEAINSMFQWYSRSKICYAFLPDVEAIDSELLDLAKDGHMENDEYNRFYSFQFTRSKWFTRGWTLQELLAPPHINFFGSDWTNLGTRNILSSCISIITRIPRHALGAHPEILRNNFSIAERMSWAAARETTRIEDAAYCLVGIFGVNMSLIYGEGEKAFSRLQEEIIKISYDHSIFAWDRSNIIDGISDSCILASRPENFRSERRIVQYSSFQFLESSYSISNVGLSIELPISTTCQGRQFCVLGCAYEDEPNGPIGIILITLDSTRNILSFGERFVVDLEQAEQAKLNRKRLIISHSLKQYIFGGWQMFRANKDDAINKFVIETERGIEHTYPEQYWNTKRRVVCFPNSTSSIGAFSIRLEHGYFVALFDIGRKSVAPEEYRHRVLALYVPRIQSFKAVIQLGFKQFSKKRYTREPQTSSCMWNRDKIELSISKKHALGLWHKMEVKLTRLD